MRKKKYIICTPNLDFTSGGSIVLNYFCHLLRQIGESSFIWPEYLGSNKERFWKRYRRRLKKDIFANNLYNNAPEWGSSEYAPFTDEILVYPETIFGNQWNAKNIVRWIMAIPGQNTDGRFKFNDNELIIGYGKECNTPMYPITDTNDIKVIYNMDDVYYQTNFNKRKKTCYMIRKARWLDKNKNKMLDLHDSTAICIDGKTHQEVAKIFNECDKFICYDTYTYFSTFATKCGCTSIVIPDEGVSKEDWKPNVKDTYGIAYGLNDVEYAIETKDKFLEYQKEIEQNNINAVKKFVKLCEEYFVD